jgi:hypothetical protein
MKYRDYIPVKDFWLGIYKWESVKPFYEMRLKVPIDKIKYDKSMFVNELSQSRVLELLLNFDRMYWDVIIINEDMYLLDGQHRMRLARLMGLKYIDAVVRKATSNKNNSKRVEIKRERSLLG